MEQEKVFTKLQGTTNWGLEYEQLNITNLTIKLATDDDVVDFKISSNDGKYRPFDDIVCEIEKRDGTLRESEKTNTKKYAIQMKHANESGELTINDLQKGKFSLLTYFQKFQDATRQSNNLNNFSLILYTNRNFDDSQREVSIGSGEKKVELVIQKCEPERLLNTGNRGCCYQFIVVDTKDIENKCLTEYKRFFNQFFLYTGQMGTEELRYNMFEREYMKQEGINAYNHFIKCWCECEEEKFLLDIHIIKAALALNLLGPYVKPLHFGNVGNTVRTEMLKEALSELVLVIFGKKQEEKVKNLWRDAKSRLEKKFQNDEIKKKLEDNLKKYLYIVAQTQAEARINELNNEQYTKLLWLLNECPLIVEANNVSRKIIKTLNLNKKIILLEERSQQFTKLKDLTHYEDFEKILNNFYCSIQGKNNVPIKTFVESCDEMLEIVTVNELIDMANDSLVICKEEEKISEPYIPRLLTRTIIKPDFLKHEQKDALVVITCWKESELFRGLSLTEVGNETDAPPDGTLYKCKDELLEHEFEKLCKKKDKSQGHQLRFTNDQQLEWVRSRGDVTVLKSFQDNTSTSEESDILNCETDNLINIISAHPGMGKTELMMNLKNNKSSSTSWTIMIYVRNHNEYFNNNKSDVKAFKDYIFERVEHRLGSGDHEFELKFLSLVRDFGFIDIRFIWDGLDEISNDHLENVLELIDGLSKEGSKHWITSRNHLKKKLEDKFKVLSKTIQPFGEAKQEEYIRKRLQAVDDGSDITKTVMKTINQYRCKDILGIPLLIFILTDLFLKDKSIFESTFSNEDDFSLYNLYEHFIRANIRYHYTHKRSYNSNNEFDAKALKKVIANKIKNYERVALKFYFQRSTEYDEFLEEIKRYNDPIGIITRCARRDDGDLSHSTYLVHILIFLSV
ncbi:uncharacterized protein LOC135142188 [Zophobas morio]|uniref:uncharacterized protein LOC135142188 n=1 Tax=Zophobas morio TaxID=2755281 RepID=UPI003083B156